MIDLLNTCYSERMKIAVSRLHLLSGEVLTNQVLTFQDGQLSSWHNLVEEEPFVAWIGGDYDMKLSVSENSSVLGIKIE